jgi:hypothetical protein
MKLFVPLFLVTVFALFLFVCQVNMCKELIKKSYIINNGYIHTYLENCQASNYYCIQATLKLERDLNEESDKVLEQESCLWLKQY